MLIYSNNLAEKLFGYAISRDFIKQQTPFCELVDDPDLKVDFDLAISFNQAINGNIAAAETFIDTFILNSANLDISTINFYRNKAITYPIFNYHINRIDYTFNNLYSLPNDTPFITRLKELSKDCLNSPCNLFKTNSNWIGKLTQSDQNANESTILSIGALKDQFTTFTGGVDSLIFNKIPQAFQRSLVELGTLGQNAWSEAQTMLTKDNTEELVEKAKSGVSLRTNTNGYVYTPDIKSYFDLAEISSNILTDIASDLGNCFDSFQHGVRYNPYNPEQNLNNTSFNPLIDQVNGKIYSRNSFGQAFPNSGGSIAGALNTYSDGDTTPNVTSRAQPATINVNNNTVDRISLYSSWIDTTTNKFYYDSNTNPKTDRGDTSTKALIGPNVYNTYKTYINNGTQDNTSLKNLKDNAFNNGFAINLETLRAYLNNAYTRDELLNIVNDKSKQSDLWIYAEITPVNKTATTVQLIDLCDEVSTIKLTPVAYKTVFNAELVSVDVDGNANLQYDDYSVINYNTNPLIQAQVRISVGLTTESQTGNIIADLKRIGFAGGSRRRDGGFNITNYWDGDTNTNQKRGNSENLLREGSVALSPDLISKYRPKVGATVFINNIKVGYYEDTTSTQWLNTVDIYDPTRKYGSVLLTASPGVAHITFGEIRAQIANPSR